MSYKDTMDLVAKIEALKVTTQDADAIRAAANRTFIALSEKRSRRKGFDALLEKQWENASHEVDRTLGVYNAASIKLATAEAELKRLRNASKQSVSRNGRSIRF